MATFPFKILNSGYQEEYQTSYVETTPDAGSQFRRERFTDVGRAINAPLLLTDMQKAQLDTFYLKDTKSGSSTFDYYDCVYNVTRPAKFLGKPSIVRSSNRWSVSCRLWLEPLTILVTEPLETEQGVAITTEDGQIIEVDVERNI